MIKIEDLIKGAFIILIVLYITHCGKDSVIVQKGHTDKEMEYALEVQKESILREIDKQKEDEAFKNISRIDSLMRYKSIRDSLRAEAYR